MGMGGCSQGLAPSGSRWEVGQNSSLRLAFPLSRSTGGSCTLTAARHPHPHSPWEVWRPPYTSGNSRKKRAAGERGVRGGPSWRRWVVGGPFPGTLGDGRPLPEKVRSPDSLLLGPGLHLAAPG